MKAVLAVVGLLAFVLASAGAIPQQYTSSVTPKVEAYKIPPDLAGVRHLDKAKDLSPERISALAERGFVVVPNKVEQMFFLYEDYGEDEEKGPIPNFITVDSVLQAYHTLFDYALRDAESGRLLKLATELTGNCCGDALKLHTEALALQAKAGPLQDAAMRNMAYFLVARKLIAGIDPDKATDVPYKNDVLKMCRQELDRIAAHAGRFPSAIMGGTVQYDQFVPRGHYTRSEGLKRYFMGLMWYGTLGMALEGGEPELVRRQCLQALLMTRMLAGNKRSGELWRRIYEPTDFFVGGADDITWQQCLPLAREVFGKDIALKALNDPQKLDRFLALARERLSVPRIAPALLEANEAGELAQVAAKPQGREFRFMGQRFIPDSYALQQLVYPLVGEDPDWRYWPSGLDVMAVLGSPRAKELLLGPLGQGKYAHYESQLAKVTREFTGKPDSEWWQNLYWAWLHCLQPLLAPKGEGYPKFMRGTAWLDKELMTAQGSWAQLRHDTILYGKPSGAEMGGAEEKTVDGYVEPYPEAYGRMAYLARLTREGLRKHDLLSSKVEEAIGRFGAMLAFLKDCSEKQLTNTPLSQDAYNRIQWFGGELERLTLDVAEGGLRLTYWSEISNETDRYMSTVADVHTSFDKCL